MTDNKVENMEGFEINLKALMEYNGSEKEVVIPQRVAIIGPEVFRKNKKLKSIVLHDDVARLDMGCFQECTKLPYIKGLGVKYIENIFGLSKTHEEAKPLIFPKVSLSKTKHNLEKVSLAMGFLLEPELYKGKLRSGYEAYVEENRDLILETARRYDIESIVKLLDTGDADGTTTEESKIVGIEQMSVAEAYELFDFKRKKTGIKIYGYKGTEKVVDIPRVIGKTSVTLVASYAFSDDKIVRCNGKTFEKLPPAIQFNTYQTFQSGEVKFSAEQIASMKAYFKKKSLVLLEAAINLKRLDFVNMFLENTYKLEEYENLIKIANEVNDASITAIVLAAKNKVFSNEELETIREIEIEKELGFREKTLSDYRKIFAIYQNKVENPGEAKYSITKCKTGLETVEIPAYIEGGLVDLYRYAFRGDFNLKTLVISDGVTHIGWGTAAVCQNLKDVYIPASVEVIEERAFNECGPELTIHAPAGSCAQHYAERNNIKFEEM